MQVFILNYLLSFYNSVDARARRLHVWWWCFWLSATHHVAMQPPEQVLALVQVPAIANTHTVFHCIFLFYCHRFTRGYWYGSFDVCARARFVFRLTHFLDANLFFFAFHFIPFVSCAQMRARAHRCMFALHTFTFVRRAQIHGKTKRNTEYNESHAKKWHGAKPRGTQHTAQG